MGRGYRDALAGRT